MNNSEIKKITHILAKIIRANIDIRGRVNGYNVNQNYYKANIHGLCTLCALALPKYGYNNSDIKKYMDELRKYVDSYTSSKTYWFDICDFNIRLQFLDHVDACLTKNVIKQFKNILI